MSTSQLTCELHGEHEAVLSCQHIGHARCGCIYVIPADDEFPQTVWCNICEEARFAEKGWFEYADSVASWGWLCGECLSSARAVAGEVVIVANPEPTPEVRGGA